jgi:thiol-disulfide isomerase/thioredoxin
MRFRIALFAIVALALSFSLLLYFIEQGQFGSIFPQSLQSSDFLGQWYNTGSNASAIAFSSLVIAVNQGTYTITVVQPCYGCIPSGNFQWSALLTVNPPNAHAFYAFQLGGSVDLQLKLLNRTSMQIKESFEVPEFAYGLAISSGIKFEQFAKIPITYATTSYSTTTYSQTSSVTVAFEGKDFTLPKVGPNGLTGETVTLSSYYGRVVVLEFIMPWDRSSQKMVPVLEKLYEQYGGQNVVFLTVSGSWPACPVEMSCPANSVEPGTPAASASDAAQFIRSYGSTWTYVYDSSNKAFNLYGVGGVPYFLVLGKTGRTITWIQGMPSYDALAAAIEQGLRAG